MRLTGMSHKVVETGHAWGNIINQNEEAFELNPGLYKSPEEAEKHHNSRALNIIDDGGADSENYEELVELVIADRQKNWQSNER